MGDPQGAPDIQEPSHSLKITVHNSEIFPLRGDCRWFDPGIAHPNWSIAIVLSGEDSEPEESRLLK